jgi:hypothetical protein
MNKTREVPKRRDSVHGILEDFKYDVDFLPTGLSLRRFNTQQLIIPNSVSRKELINILLKKQVEFMKNEMELLQRLYAKYAEDAN